MPLRASYIYICNKLHEQRKQKQGTLTS